MILILPPNFLCNAIASPAAGYVTGALIPVDGGLSASIGVAQYPGAGTVLERLLHAADTALYQAKNTGRNKVVSIARAA